MLSHYQVDGVWEPHLGVRLCQSNERLQLTRESRDLAATAANLKLAEIIRYTFGR